MNKVQIGLKLHEIAENINAAGTLTTIDVDTIRKSIMDLTSTILIEEYKGVVTPQLLNCQACELHTTRSHIVSGMGPIPADIMFVGEAPGFIEDTQGKPFVGPAGQMLDTILKAAQKKLPNGNRWKRENIYITNTIKCRPENNRTPNVVERAACNCYLVEEIQRVKPKVIVCWGAVAASEIIHPNFKIAQETGIMFVKDDMKLIALYHPSYILRMQDLKDAKTSEVKNAVWDGLKKVNDYLEQAIDK